MAQWNLLKLKKYEGLVSEDDSIHSIHTVNQISDISKSSGHFFQSGNVDHAMPTGQDGQSNPISPQYPNNQYQNSYQCAAPYFQTCYVCETFGHLGKNCPNWVNNHQNVQLYLQSLPPTFPPSLSSNTTQNISSNIFTPKRPPVLTQQLTADYIMSQHAWDKTTTKVNEMAKENKLNKEAVCKTYNTATGVLGRSKNKTLAANPNDRTNNCKQSNQGSKSVWFSSRDQDTKSNTTPLQKAKSTNQF